MDRRSFSSNNRKKQSFHKRTIGRHNNKGWISQLSTCKTTCRYMLRINETVDNALYHGTAYKSCKCDNDNAPNISKMTVSKCKICLGVLKSGIKSFHVLALDFQSTSNSRNNGKFSFAFIAAIDNGSTKFYMIHSGFRRMYFISMASERLSSYNDYKLISLDIGSDDVSKNQISLNSIYHLYKMSYLRSFPIQKLNFFNSNMIITNNNFSLNSEESMHIGDAVENDRALLTLSTLHAKQFYSNINSISRAEVSNSDNLSNSGYSSSQVLSRAESEHAFD